MKIRHNYPLKKRENRMEISKAGFGLKIASFGAFGKWLIISVLSFCACGAGQLTLLWAILLHLAGTFVTP